MTLRVCRLRPNALLDAVQRNGVRRDGVRRDEPLRARRDEALRNVIAE